MHQDFTLIELMVIISIIGILAGMIIPAFMDKKSAIPEPMPEPSPKVELKVDGNTFTVQKITFDGHSYFFIDGRTRVGWNVVHNPECPKCKPSTASTHVETVEQ